MVKPLKKNMHSNIIGSGQKVIERKEIVFYDPQLGYKCQNSAIILLLLYFIAYTIEQFLTRGVIY